VSDAVALGWRQFRLERKQFWRNPTAAFFDFLLPVVFLLIIGSLTPASDRDIIIPGIAGMNVMASTFNAIAMNMTFRREQGLLKRMRGTPMPTGAYLGGRTFDVVLTRQPLAYLHQSLDEALARFPERRLLGDFRAPEDLVAAEAEALAAADRIITPHAEIARRFGKRAVLLPWLLPRTERVSPCGTSGTIAFPGPAAARKGAYEVREAARALGLTVLLIGKSLEGPDFWEGIPTRRSDDDWLSEEIGAVVQPAVVEDQPRALLRAIAAGLPVIATAACGLGDAYPDVTTIPALDAAALVDALRDRL